MKIAVLTRATFLGAGLVVSSLGIAAQAQAAPTLIAHRAIYELSLNRSSGGSAGVTGLSGRLVIEMMGSACEGYTVNFRLVTQFSDSDGQMTTSDLRSSTFEGGEGETFRFLTQNFVNQAMTEETDGIATREGRESTEVTLTKPAESAFTLEPSILFPTEHLKAIINAAGEGDSLLQATIFDGSESGQKTYETTAVIGREQEDAAPAPAPGANALDDVTRWPVTISYYEGEAVGEQTPVYEISFDLYENGVSSDLRLDYGDFAIDGKLASLDVLAADDCKP